MAQNKDTKLLTVVDNKIRSSANALITRNTRKARVKRTIRRTRRIWRLPVPWSKPDKTYRSRLQEEMMNASRQLNHLTLFRMMSQKKAQRSTCSLKDSSQMKIAL